MTSSEYDEMMRKKMLDDCQIKAMTPEEAERITETMSGLRDMYYPQDATISGAPGIPYDPLAYRPTYPMGRSTGYIIFLYCLAATPTIILVLHLLGWA